jgi:hypothetical protein
MKTNIALTVATIAALTACGGSSSGGKSQIQSTSTSTSSAAPAPVYGYLSTSFLYDGTLFNNGTTDTWVDDYGVTQIAAAGTIKTSSVIQIDGVVGNRTATAYTVMDGKGQVPCYRIAEFSDLNSAFNSENERGELQGTLLTEEPSASAPKAHAYFKNEYADKNGLTWNFKIDTQFAYGSTLDSLTYSGTTKNVGYVTVDADNSKINSSIFYKDNNLTLNVSGNAPLNIASIPKTPSELKSRMCPDLRVHPKYVKSDKYVGLYDTTYFAGLNNTNEIKQFMSIDKDGIVQVYEWDRTNHLNCFQSHNSKVDQDYMNGKRLSFDPVNRSLYAFAYGVRYDLWLNGQGDIESVGPKKTEKYVGFIETNLNSQAVLSAKKASVTIEQIQSQLCTQ